MGNVSTISRALQKMQGAAQLTAHAVSRLDRAEGLAAVAGDDARRGQDSALVSAYRFAVNAKGEFDKAMDELRAVAGEQIVADVEKALSEGTSTLEARKEPSNVKPVRPGVLGIVSSGKPDSPEPPRAA